MIVTEQDRADAMELIPYLIRKYPLELAIVDALDQHRPLWEQSLNLGYYRTFVECSCGTGIWYGDHEGDPAWVDRWALHRASVVSDAIANR